MCSIFNESPFKQIPQVITPRVINQLIYFHLSLPMVKGGPTSTTFLLVERIFAIMAINLDKVAKIEPSATDLYVSSLLGPLGLFHRTSLMKTQPVYNGNNLAALQSHLSEPLKLLKDALFTCPPPLQKAINKGFPFSPYLHNCS
jgi:hypothetical protein